MQLGLGLFCEHQPFSLRNTMLMLIIVLNLLMCSNYELISICNQQCTKSVKWSCSWWKKSDTDCYLGRDYLKYPTSLGILTAGECLIVQFVVQNLHFYYCCIKLKLSLEKKNTLLFTVNHMPLFFNSSIYTNYQYLRAKHSSM